MKSWSSLLRVNVSIIQSDAEQGSVDLADFHIYCSVFYANHHGPISFSRGLICQNFKLL